MSYSDLESLSLFPHLIITDEAKEFHYFNQIFSLLMFYIASSSPEFFRSLWGSDVKITFALERGSCLFSCMEDGTNVIKLKKIRQFMVLGSFFCYTVLLDVFMCKSIACGLYEKVLLPDSWALQNMKSSFFCTAANIGKIISLGEIKDPE